MSETEKYVESIRKILSTLLTVYGRDIHLEMRKIYGDSWSWGGTMSIVGGLMAKKQVYSPRLGYFKLIHNWVE